MTPLAVQAARYGVVGIVNTVVGLTCILVLMAAGLGDIAANVLGYIAGFGISFVLNGRWTFGARALGRRELVRFASVIGVAYGANLLALIAVRDGLSLGSVAGQCAGVVVYATVGFIGSRCFAFASRR